jgi:hypothetical protein
METSPVFHGESQFAPAGNPENESHSRGAGMTMKMRTRSHPVCRAIKPCGLIGLNRYGPFARPRIGPHHHFAWPKLLMRGWSRRPAALIAPSFRRAAVCPGYIRVCLCASAGASSPSSAVLSTVSSTPQNRRSSPSCMRKPAIVSRGRSSAEFASIRTNGRGRI